MRERSFRSSLQERERGQEGCEAEVMEGFGEVRVGEWSRAEGYEEEVEGPANGCGWVGGGIGRSGRRGRLARPLPEPSC